MNPIVFIGGPERGAGTRGHTSGSPCAAARATNSHRERNGAKASSAICHGPVFSVRERTVRAIIENVAAPGSVPDADTIKAVRRNSRESFTASRNRIPGSLSVQLRQKSRYVRCPFTHVDNPFRVALASEKQSARKGKQGVGERPQELVKQGQGDE